MVQTQTAVYGGTRCSSFQKERHSWPPKIRTTRRAGLGVRLDLPSAGDWVEEKNWPRKAAGRDNSPESEQSRKMGVA